MAQRKYNTDLTDLLLKCMSEPDTMLSMLEWLRTQRFKHSLILLRVPKLRTSLDAIPRSDIN
jgi:hypothetical protein